MNTVSRYLILSVSLLLGGCAGLVTFFNAGSVVTNASNVYEEVRAYLDEDEIEAIQIADDYFVAVYVNVYRQDGSLPIRQLAKEFPEQFIPYECQYDSIELDDDSWRIECEWKLLDTVMLAHQARTKEPLPPLYTAFRVQAPSLFTKFKKAIESNDNAVKVIEFYQSIKPLVPAVLAVLADKPFPALPEPPARTRYAAHDHRLSVPALE